MIPIYDLHNFFDALSAPIRAEFDSVSRYRQVKAGTVLVRTGDIRDTLSQIVEGAVRYCSCDSRGRETVTATMKQGDWIGLSEILTGIPAMVDVIATTPVRLRTIARRDFEVLLDRHPVVARRLLRLFGLRFALVYRLAQDRSELTLRERLLKMLYILSFDQAQPVEAADGGTLIRLSQDELAKMLAASRQTLNRLLRTLEQEGLVSLGYRTIRLAPRPQLERSYGYLFGTTEPAAL